MLSLKCNDIIGNPIELYFAKETYVEGDGAAFLTVSPESLLEEGDGLYSVLSVNLPFDPIAAEWCSEPGHFILDTNNNSRGLVDQLVNSGIVRLDGRSVASGYCTYPLASIPESMLNEIPEYSAIYTELAKAGVLDRTAEGIEGWDTGNDALAFEEDDNSVNVYFMSGTGTVHWAKNYSPSDVDKAVNAFAAIVFEGADPEKDGWPEGIPVGSGEAQDQFASDTEAWDKRALACLSGFGREKSLELFDAFGDTGKAFVHACAEKQKDMEASRSEEEEPGRDSIDTGELGER